MITFDLKGARESPLKEISMAKILDGIRVFDLKMCIRDRVVFFARIERARDDPPSAPFDVSDQWRKFFALASSGENGESFGGELPGDRRARCV